MMMQLPSWWGSWPKLQPCPACSLNSSSLSNNKHVNLIDSPSYTSSTASTTMGIQQNASGAFARAQSLVDKVVSPSTRKTYYDKTSAFAHEQPLLFVCPHGSLSSPLPISPDHSYANKPQTFLLIQVIISSTPIALFLSFALGTLALSFITALLFSLFWIGVALLLLIPTLFITVSLGIVVWIWAVSSFLVARWVYNIVPVRAVKTTEEQLRDSLEVGAAEIYFTEFNLVKVQWVKPAQKDCGQAT